MSAIKLLTIGGDTIKQTARFAAGRHLPFWRKPDLQPGLIRAFFRPPTGTLVGHKKGMGMSKRKLLFGMVGAAVALSVFGASYWWISMKPVTGVENAVREALNDPESARFKGVRFYKNTGAGCGFVNSKNRMGGYVGDQLFIRFADGEVRFGPVEVDVADSARFLDYTQKYVNFSTLRSANCRDEKGNAW